MKITSCERAEIKSCFYCRSKDPSRPDRCYIETMHKGLMSACEFGGAATFKQYILKYVLYYKGKQDIQGNQSMSYLVAAMKRYYPQHIDDLNKMLLLL